ncbi:hypothetical protein MRX96_034755 [Rhipicephalus microplus]
MRTRRESSYLRQSKVDSSCLRKTLPIAFLARGRLKPMTAMPERSPVSFSTTISSDVVGNVAEEVCEERYRHAPPLR